MMAGCCMRGTERNWLIIDGLVDAGERRISPPGARKAGKQCGAVGGLGGQGRTRKQQVLPVVHGRRLLCRASPQSQSNRDQGLAHPTQIPMYIQFAHPGCSCDRKLRLCIVRSGKQHKARHMCLPRDLHTLLPDLTSLSTPQETRPNRMPSTSLNTRPNPFGQQRRLSPRRDPHASLPRLGTRGLIAAAVVVMVAVVHQTAAVSRPRQSRPPSKVSSDAGRIIGARPDHRVGGSVAAWSNRSWTSRAVSPAASSLWLLWC